MDCLKKRQATPPSDPSIVHQCLGELAGHSLYLHRIKERTGQYLRRVQEVD